jgi:putative tryptophan/tyrosine transport system substrate-binding protein
VLLYGTPQADPQMETIRRGLRELGYSEGQNLVMSYHYAEGKPERLADLAAALVRENPDLVLALGGDVAPSAVKATSIIPIVFVSSADPVQLGLAASLARPAGNATGVTLLQDDLASKRLELLREAVPRVKHVAFVWNPDHPDNELREAERAAQSLNVGLQLVEMRGPGDLETVFRRLPTAKNISGGGGERGSDAPVNNGGAGMIRASFGAPFARPYSCERAGAVSQGLEGEGRAPKGRYEAQYRRRR